MAKEIFLVLSDTAFLVFLRMNFKSKSKKKENNEQNAG